MPPLLLSIAAPKMKPKLNPKSALLSLLTPTADVVEGDTVKKATNKQKSVEKKKTATGLLVPAAKDATKPTAAEKKTVKKTPETPKKASKVAPSTKILKGPKKSHSVKDGSSAVTSKPRKPSSAFFNWAKQKKKKLKEEEPTKEISNEHLEQLWKSMEVKDKAPFEEKYAKANTKYELLLAAFKKLSKKRKIDEKELAGEPSAKKIKGPSNAFFYFSNEKRPDIKAAHPSLTFGGLGKKLGEMWKATTDEEKAPFIKMQTDAKDAHTKLMAKEIEAGRGPVAKPKKIKGPSNAFFYFSNEKRPDIKAAHPSLTFGGLGKKLGEMWKATTDEEKAPFIKMQTDAKDAHTKLMTEEMNAFTLFCTDKRGDVVAAHPGLNSRNIRKILGILWKAATDEEKKVFQDQAAKLKADEAESENGEKRGDLSRSTQNLGLPSLSVIDEKDSKEASEEEHERTLPNQSDDKEIEMMMADHEEEPTEITA